MSELFSYGPKNIREFLSKNLVPILYTIILHMLVAIVLVFAKVDSLKEDMELGVVLDFTEEKTLEEMLEEETVEVPAEWIELVYEARQAASNQAVNLNDKVNKEISTDDYVNQLLDELEAQKDEDFLKDREKWEEILSSKVYEKEALPIEEVDEEHPFTGPTTITFEFLNSPKDRQSRFLSIPVYRCEGSGLVIVDIVVLQTGVVQSASVISTQSEFNPECFSEAAEEAALNSLFKSDYTGPEKHKARISYQFVAQ